MKQDVKSAALFNALKSLADSGFVKLRAEASVSWGTEERLCYGYV